MSYFSLIYLGIFSLVISVLSFFNIVYSYYFNFYLNLDCYIYSLLVSLFFGLFFLIKKKDTYNIKTECMGRMALADETENPIRIKLFG